MKTTGTSATKPLCLMLLLLAAAGATAAHSPASPTLRFAFVGEERAGAAAGAAQGIHEANLQGRFLGQHYSLENIAAADLEATDPAGYIAVIVAGDAALLQQVGRRFKDHAVFNVRAHDDALRAACAPNLLHVIPSSKMLADARAQWLQKHPGEEVSASAWHPDFVKFAARDLNKRYRKRFSLPMEQYAWAGWAAIKMTSDSVARKNLREPGELLEHLKTALSFDGQKGLDMNFRPTGQLRQPLLLLDAQGRLLGEAPVRGVAAPTDVDSLGLPACPDQPQSVPSD